MEEDLFKDEIERLGKNFGLRGQILNDKMDILWEEFKTIPDNIFKKGCKALLETEDRFPNIKRFKEVLSGYFARNFVISPNRESSPLIPSPPSPCKLCEGSGMFSTMKKRQVGDQSVWHGYAFRCSCPRGALYAHQIPVWDLLWLRNGHVPFAEWQIIKEMEDSEDPAKVSPDERKGVLFESLEKISGMLKSRRSAPIKSNNVEDPKIE